MLFASAALAQLLPAPVAAQGNGELLQLTAQARQRGCKGHEGTAAPLRESAALNRAAARIGKGQPAQQAAEQAGYRLTRIFNASLSGYRSAADVAQALAANYCDAITDPRFVDFGLHQQGRQWTVVLGAPFQVPKLADRKAALQRVLALTNQARGKPRTCGDESFDAAPPLQWDQKLAQAAARHAQDMAAHGYIAHRGRDGSTPSQRITQAGYRWRSVGENVAAGQPSPEEVVDDWLSSPGHCANLMSPSFTELGVAFAVNMQAPDAVYWAQAFGRPR